MSKKIVFIINSLKSKSGMERVACNLTNLFIDKFGYEVSLLNRDTSGQNVAYSLSKKAKVYDLTGSYILFYKKIQHYLNSEKPDFIVVHNMGRLSLLCSLLSLGKAKLISMEHVAFNVRPIWVRFLSKLFYKKISKVITLTYQDSLNYRTWFNDVCIINNISPFLISNYKYSENSNKIVAIGRLTYQKNFEALLEAWRLIQEYDKNWFLEIYGKGENERELKTFIDSHQLTNVKLMGLADNVENIYRKSSIFVMSSRFEGLPMVLIEAQTFGLPIISFNCPHGPSEIVHHKKNGLLVENQNIEALAKSMLELMANKEMRIQYSLQAIKDAERFQESYILNLWKTKVFGEIE